MKLDRKSGAALAAAAALLMMSATVPVAPAAADYKVKCFGLNSCKAMANASRSAILAPVRIAARAKVFL
jgi:hypothetical protein